MEKNGITAGDKKNPILKIEIKDVDSQPITIYTYNNENDGWEENFKKKKKIYGLKLASTYEIMENNKLCYRIYNKENKWLNWSCLSTSVSGNKEEAITALEIKIIPKNVVLQEYLKDYIDNENPISIGF